MFDDTIASAAWFARKPDIAMARAEPKLILAASDQPCRPLAELSAQHVHQILNHAVGCGHHLSVRGIGLLGHDQHGELIGAVGLVAVTRRAAHGAGDPEPRLLAMVTADWPLMVTPGTVIADPVGLVKTPLGPNVNVVPVLTHATWVPVALGLL